MASPNPPVAQTPEEDVWGKVKPQDILLDPGFHAQNPKVKRVILKRITPDWDNIPPADQEATISAPMEYWTEYFESMKPKEPTFKEKAIEFGKKVITKYGEGQIEQAAALRQAYQPQRKMELPPELPPEPVFDAVSKRRANRPTEGLIEKGTKDVFDEYTKGMPFSAKVLSTNKGAVLVPSLNPETMQPISDDEAWQKYLETGEHYGVFKDLKAAKDYVDQLKKDSKEVGIRPQKKGEEFDAEGSGYDYRSALAAGLGPDAEGHWPSRDPKTGLILKGSKHPTWAKTAEAEGGLGNVMIKRDDGRYYSIPEGEDRAALGLDPQEKLDSAPIAVPYTGKDGKTILLLGKYQGKVLDSRAALDLYEKTNYNYGKFDTPEEAQEFSAWLASQPEAVQDNVLTIAKSDDGRDRGLAGARIEFREPTKKGIKEFMQEKADLGEAMKLLPFLGSIEEIGELSQVYMAAQRINEHDPKDWYDGRGWDEQVLSEYQDNILEDAIRGSSRWYNILNIGSQIPGFALEFVATGGAFSAGKESVEKVITKALGRMAQKKIGRVVAKTGGAAAGAAAQTTLMPQLVARETLSRMAPQAVVEKLDDETVRVMFEPGEDFMEALAKGAPSAFIEVASERTGELVPMLGKTLKETKLGQYFRKLPINDKLSALKAAIAARWFKMNPNKSIQDFMKTIKEKAAWNGILGEMFEERVGEVARDVFGITDPEEWSATVRLATGIQAQPGSTPWEVRKQALIELGDQMLTEAAAFSLPGAIGKVLSYRPGRKDKAPGPAPKTPIDEALEVAEAELDKAIADLEAQQAAQRRATGETSTETPQELPGPGKAEQPKKLPGEPTERHITDINRKIQELRNGDRKAVFIPRGARAVDRKAAIANAPAKAKVFWSVNGAIIYDPDQIAPEEIITMLEEGREGELYGRNKPDLPAELPAEPGAEPQTEAEAAEAAAERGIAEPDDQITPEQQPVIPKAPPARTIENPFDWTGRVPTGEEMVGQFVLTPYGAGLIQDDEGETFPEGTIAVGLSGGRSIRMRTDNVMLLDSTAPDFEEANFLFRTPKNLSINPNSEYANLEEGPLYEQMRADAMNALFGILRAEHRPEGEGLPGSRYDNITFSQQVYARAIQEISDTFGSAAARKAEADISSMVNRVVGKPVATRSPHEIEGLPTGVSFDGVTYGEGGKTIAGFNYTAHDLKSPEMEAGGTKITVAPGESLATAFAEAKRKFDTAEQLRKQFIEQGAGTRLETPTGYAGHLSPVMTRDMSLSGPVKALLDRKLSHAEALGIDNEIVLGFVQGLDRDAIVEQIMKEHPDIDQNKDAIRRMVSAIKQINMIPNSDDRGFTAWQNRAREQVRQEFERFISLPTEFDKPPIEEKEGEGAPPTAEKKHTGPLTDLYEDDPKLIGDPKKAGVVSMLRRQLARAVDAGAASDIMLGLVHGKSVDDIAGDVIVNRKAMAEMQIDQVRAIIRAVKQLKGVPNSGTAEFTSWQKLALDKMSQWETPEAERPGPEELPEELTEEPVGPETHGQEELPTELPGEGVIIVEGFPVSKKTGDVDRRQKEVETPEERERREGKDRRSDKKKRKDVADMTREELIQELLTDRLTGLFNLSAWDRIDKKKYVGMIDLNKMKRINDTYGHVTGDAYLKYIAQGFREAGLDVYRTGGDEFHVTADSQDEIDNAMAKAKAWFSANTLKISTEDTLQEKVHGAFSYGVGLTEEEAEKAQEQAKEAGIASGELEKRQERGPLKAKVEEFVDYGNQFLKDVDAALRSGQPPQAPDIETILARAGGVSDHIKMGHQFLEQPDVFHGGLDAQINYALKPLLQWADETGARDNDQGRAYMDSVTKVFHNAGADMERMVPRKKVKGPAPQPKAKTFKVEFLVNGTWSSNSIRFATKEEAQKYGEMKFAAWTVPEEFRVSESEEAVNYRWDDAKGDIVDITKEAAEPEQQPGQPPAVPTSDAMKKAMEEIKKKLGKRTTLSMAVEGSGAAGPSREELLNDIEVFDNLVIMGGEFRKAGIVSRAEWHAGMHAAAEDLASGFGNDIEPLFPLIWAAVTGEEDYLGGIGGVYGATEEGEPAGPGAGGLQAPGGATGGAPGGIQPGATGEPGAQGGEGGIPPREGAGGEGGVPTGAEGGDVGATGGGTAEPGTVSDTRDYPRYTGRFFELNEEVGFGEGGWKGKLSNNLEAIRTLMTLRAENRYPTEEEKVKLARFIGWGGLWQVLEYGHSKYVDERKELRHLLSEEEWERARASTQNAHYTAEKIARSLWHMVQKLGFKGEGNVLEGATGSGVFLGTAPDDIANTSKFVGTELDPITAEIAQHLYPAAKIMARGFQTLEFPDNTIDLAISNVPFGGKIFDKRYAVMNPSIHDYYFLKTVDKLRPGGLLVYITSTFTMDKRSDRIRRMLDNKADLVSAFRLPNGTFMNNAGTGVATDVIILRKRMPGEVREETPWGRNKWMDAPMISVPELASPGEETRISVNEYFIVNPDHVLGTMTNNRDAHNNPRVVIPPKDIKDEHLSLVDWVSNKLRDWSWSLPEDAYVSDPDLVEPKTLNFIDRFGDENVWENQIILHPETGALVRKVGNLLEPLEQTILSLPNAESAIKDLIKVRERLWEVFRVQISSNSDDLLKTAQVDLEGAYDAFVSRHGYIGSRYVKGLMWNDPTYYFLSGLEVADHDNGSVSKTAIFTKRSMRPHMPLETLPEDIHDALLLVYAHRGFVDLQLMAKLSEKTADEWEAELRDEGLIFKNPVTGKLELPEEYLSGDIYDKLDDAAKAIPLDPTYEVNLDALQAAKPELIPIDSEDPNKMFEVKVGSSWIKDDYYIGFLQYLLADEYLSVDITRTERKNEVRIAIDGYVSPTIMYQKWGTPYKDAVTLLQLAINHKRPIVRIKDSEGVPRKSEKDTLEAQLVQTKIKEEFSKWARKSKFAEEMEIEYNSRYNRIRLREYNGAHLTFEGMNRAILRSGELEPHQQNAVWRIVQEGKAMLAHFVGSGKTFIMAAAAMELRKMGLAKKVMISVPKSVYRQVGTDFARLYPGAKLLIVDEKDFTPENRKKLFAKIAMEDWDAIILSHEQLGSIPMSPSRTSLFIHDQIEQLEEAISNMGPQKTKTGKASLKKLQKRLDDYRAKLESLLNMRQDDTIYFDNMGVDMLMVDEAHRFKGLPVTTSQGGIAGLDTTGSKRSIALKIKTDFLLERYNDRGVVFSTGTPVSNSMVELYNFNMYLDPIGLRNAGIRTFDEWAANFCNVVTIYGTKADGRTYGPQNVFGEFTNLVDLQQMFRKYADVINRESMEFPVPKVKVDPETGGEYTLLTLKPNDWVDEYFESILKRMKFLKDNPGFDKRIDNLLKINNDARMASLDGRLVSGEAPDDPLSKANHAVKMLTDYWVDTKDKRKTQVVFVDRFQNAETGFNLYEDMRNKLLKNGIPDSEIAVIHEFNTPDKLRDLYRDMRRGKVRILLTTSKTSEGANIQTRLGRLYHLSAPWTPKEMEQREGRIIRQQNLHFEWGEEVEIIQMATERTFDARIFEILRRKARFIRQYLKGDSDVRKASDPAAKVVVNYEMISAIASGNPDYQIKVQLEAQYANFEVLYERFLSNKKQLKWRLNKAEQDILKIRQAVNTTRHYNEEFQKQREPFSVNIDGETFTDPDKARDYVKALQESGVPNPKIEEGKELEEGEPEIVPYEPKFNNRHMTPEEAIGKIDYRAVLENREFKFNAVIAGVKYGNQKEAEEALAALAEPLRKIKEKSHTIEIEVYGTPVKVDLEWQHTLGAHTVLTTFVGKTKQVPVDSTVVQRVIHDLHDLKRQIVVLEGQIKTLTEENNKIRAEIEAPFAELEPMMSVKRELNAVNERLGLRNMDEEGEIEDEGADDDDDADPVEDDSDGISRDMPADKEDWAAEDEMFDLLQPYRDIHVPGSERAGDSVWPMWPSETQRTVNKEEAESRAKTLKTAKNTLTRSGLSVENLGAYLFFARPAEERSLLPNPTEAFGKTITSLEDIKEELGDEAYKTLERVAEDLAEFSYPEIEAQFEKRKASGARVPKPEILMQPPLPVEAEAGPEFLYTRAMTYELADSLDKGILPDEIVDELKNKGKILAPIRRVSKLKQKNGWEISDGLYILQIFQNEQNPDIAEVYDAIGYGRVQIPELLWLNEQISGKHLGVKKMRKAFGHMIPDGKGGLVEIRPDLAYMLKDREQLARTMAHEIGHTVDYAPDNLMNKGNLIGRLLSLRSFTRNMHPAVKGTNARMLKQELTALSDYWRPWDRATATADYTEYRAKPEELYADFISALLLSPGTAMRMAPKMYDLFHKNLDTKPDVKKAYFELRLLLAGDKEDLLQHRLERYGVMFKKASDVSMALMNETMGKEHGWLARVRFQVDDLRWQIKRRVRQMQKKGVYSPVEDSNPLWLFDELPVKIHTDTFRHFEKVDKKIGEYLRVGGVDRVYLDIFFALNRAAHSRMNMFNPIIGTGEYAPETIGQLEKFLGKERFEMVKNAARMYADIRWPLIEECERSGVFSPELVEKVFLPQKYDYTKFTPLQHIRSYVSTAVLEQVGFAGDIASPFVETLKLDEALIKLIARNNAVRATLDFTHAYYPEDIKPAEQVNKGKKEPPRYKNPPPNMDIVQVMIDGHPKGFYVDKYLAEQCNTLSPERTLALARPLEIYQRKWFWKIAILYNFAFGGWSNIVRDIKRNYRMLPLKGVIIGDVFQLISRYATAAPHAFKWLWRNKRSDELINEIIDSYSFAMPLLDVMMDEADPYTHLLKKSGVISQDGQINSSKASKFIYKSLRILGSPIKLLFNAGEMTSKTAGYLIRKEAGETGKELAYNMRNFTSTPNYTVKGKYQHTTNGIWVFSTIMKESWKSEYFAATDPKMRSGYWFRTSKLLMLKLIQIAAELGALAGLFGDDLEKAYKSATNYMLNNYLCVPLGAPDENGKVSFLQIPEDEMTRLLGGVLRNIVMMMKDEDPAEFQDLMSFVTSQLMPSFSPAITTIAGWTAVLSGIPIMDKFRGNMVIPQDVWDAGGWEKWKKMIQWTMSENGLGGFTTWDDFRQTRYQIWTQSEPIIGKWIGRIVKTTNYGLTEKMRRDEERQNRERARSRLSRKHSTQLVASFYAIKYDVDRQHLRRQDRLNKGGAPAELASEYPLAIYNKAFDKADTSLRKLQNQIDLIEDNKDMNDRKKMLEIVKIKQRMDSIAKKVLIDTGMTGRGERDLPDDFAPPPDIFSEE